MHVLWLSMASFYDFFYCLLELFRQCWFLFSILFIGFWNCSDSVSFYFPFYLLAFGTVPTVLVFVFHFFIGFWNCSDSVGFYFPFFLFTFGTVPTVLVFVFHFIYWLLELFRQCWFLFSIFLLAFGNVPTVLVFIFHFFIGFWNCSDNVGFCFPFYYCKAVVNRLRH